MTEQSHSRKMDETIIRTDERVLQMLKMQSEEKSARMKFEDEVRLHQTKDIEEHTDMKVSIHKGKRHSALIAVLSGILSGLGFHVSS